MAFVVKAKAPFAPHKISCCIYGSYGRGNSEQLRNLQELAQCIQNIYMTKIQAEWIVTDSRHLCILKLLWTSTLYVHRSLSELKWAPLMAKSKFCSLVCV